MTTTKSGNLSSEAEYLAEYQAFTSTLNGLRLLDKHRECSGLWDMARLQGRRLDDYEAEHDADRKGDWIPLYSGRRFWLEDPRWYDICIEDIAHPLSLICRFGGHSNFHYSVAQHSVLCSYLVPEEYAMFALMHDAGEAYLGDQITPFKRLFKEFYDSMESPIMEAVARHFRFSMDVEAKQAVKRADLRMLVTECRDVTTLGILNKKINGLLLEYPPLRGSIGAINCEFAEELFMTRYNELAARTK